MSMEQDKRLVTIFSASGWNRFVDELVTRRNRGSVLQGTFSLANSTEEERRSYARLLRLSKPLDRPKLRYDLERIRAALSNQGIAVEWLQLLEALRGAIPPELVLNLEARRAWSNFWPWAESHVAAQSFPHACEWLNTLRKDGSLVRQSRDQCQVATDRLTVACGVLSQLPAGDEPLASVAARLCGNSHALDTNSPLASLVLKCLALQRGVPVPERSEDRRKLWESFGVVCDDVSAPVLTFNLGLIGSSWITRLISEATDACQPLYLSNRMVATADWSSVGYPTHVFVCENPTILSLAANRLQHACPPMVCVNGEPRSTSRSLLSRLRAGGSILWYHGDFDWPGIAIASRLMSELGARPWLMSAKDYEFAISLGLTRDLSGDPLETLWDPALSQAMQSRKKAIDEEALAEAMMQSMLCVNDGDLTHSSRQ